MSTKKQAVGAKAPSADKLPKASVRNRTWPGGLPVVPGRKSPWSDLPADAIEQKIAEARADPSAQAHRRLYDILNEASVDPVILQDDEVTRLLHLVRELLTDSWPGETLEQMLRPLQTLMAAAAGDQGGRPRATSIWEEWHKRFQEKKARNRLRTTREIYEDVAAEWSEGHAEVKWTAVRDGISKLKKLQKNRV